MTKTVSARIPNKYHEELLERCNRSGCTINEWINACIDYLLTGSSEFDFGDEEVKEETNSNDNAESNTKPQVIFTE